MSNHQNLNNPTIWMPTTIEDATKLKKQFNIDSEFASGTTLLQLQWINGRKLPKHMISLEQISTMKKIEKNEESNLLAIGALVTLGSYQTDKTLQQFPVLCEALKTIAAPAVRNRGTIGGNIMGGIGDLIPLMLSVDAILEFHNGDSYQNIKMNDYLREIDKVNGLLTTIYIPFVENSSLQSVFYKKIGRRETFTAAILTVSGEIRWNAEGTIDDLRLAIGGGDNQPMRLEKTEQLLRTQNLDNINWKKIYESLMSELSPTEDVFVSSQYRKKAATNLIISELQSHLASKGYREEHAYEV